jgi:hypothetical protein
VQTNALRIEAELAESRVLLAEAEVLGVDQICKVGVGRISVEHRRDLDPDFARVRLIFFSSSEAGYERASS